MNIFVNTLSRCFRIPLFLIRKNYYRKTKAIKISRKAFVDNNSVLEGNNVLTAKVRITNSSVGFGTYFGYNTCFDSAKIGRYSSIGSNIRLITGRHPTSVFVSTHPAFFSLANQIGKTYVSSQLFEEFKYASGHYSIIIGNDVWIGSESIIIEGVTIGDGVIIAAGSVVVKDVPPYAIVGGNPAKIIRFRFCESDVEFLESLRWWDRGESWIKEHSRYFNDIKSLIKICEEEQSQ